MGNSEYPSDYDPEDSEPEIANGLPPEFNKRRRANEDEILARQELIMNFKTIAPSLTIADLQHQLEVKGYTIQKSTIHRDLQEIEQRAWNWSDGLARSGFVYSCQQASKRSSDLIAILHQALNSTKEPRDIAALAKTINELQLTKINIEGRATYQRLKLARDKYMGAEELKSRFDE